MLREVQGAGDKVIAMVFGDTPRARDIAQRATVRAEDHPARQVVVMPDRRVAEGAPDLARFIGLSEDGTEIAFFTLDFKLSSRLRGEDALSFAKLELAFASALAGDAE